MRLISRLPHAIALRLTLAVALGLGVVISAIGIQVVTSEERELHDWVTAEMMLLTRSIQIAFENAIRDRQIADIEQTLTELQATGPRMAMQARIYEPFFTTRLQSGGSGLGLSIVRSLLSRHGGSARVASVEGQGARFEVLIPYARPEDVGAGA